MPCPDRKAVIHLTETIGSAIDGLARMLAIDTSFPPGAGYAAFADLLEVMIAPLGLERQRIIVPQALWRVPDGPARGERVNLIATRRTGKPLLGLYFHTDTVPPAAGWTRDPFALTREGDRLHGLGAADMKGSIAAVLLALRAAEACAIPLAYDPMLLFCTDEEGGLYPGIRHVAEQGLLEGHVLNFNGTAAPRIWAGCFGLFNLRLRISGRAGHAGEAGGTVNAIEAALPVMNALIALQPSIAARRSALPPAPGAPPLRGSLAIAAANGGTSGGQVPSRFDILVNRRYPPEEAFEAARDEIVAACRAALPERAGMEIALLGHLMPTADPGGPHWARWQAALSAGFGYAPGDFRRWAASSCSDFGWVQRATGQSEILLSGLGRPERGVHTPDEHTTTHDIIALAHSVLAYLAADFAPELNPDRSFA